MNEFKITYNDFGGGVNDYSSPFLVSATETPYSLNADFQIPGKVRKALGFSSIGTVASGTGSIRGLFSYDKEDGTRTLMAAFRTGLYSYTGSGWNTTSGAVFTSGTNNVEGLNAYVDGQERVYMTEGFNSTLAYFDGTGTYNIANIYAKHMAYYKYRLYLGNVKVSSTTYPQRILFSPEGEDTFDTTNDIIDDLGEPITALKVYGGYLYIFSENKIATYDGTYLNIIATSGGTTSSRSVRESEGRLIWYNRSGVYMYAGAGLPTKISKRVQGWIDAISDASTVAGGIDKFGRYVLTIGNVTYKGGSVSKVALIYDVLNNNWEVHTGRKFGVIATVQDDGATTAYGGDDSTGEVYKLDYGYDLAGSAQAFKWRTTVLDAGLPEKQKNIWKSILSYKPNATTGFLTMNYRVDGASGWSQINATNNNFALSGTDAFRSSEIFPKQIQAKYLEFEVSESSLSGNFELYSISLEGNSLNE